MASIATVSFKELLLKVASSTAKLLNEKQQQLQQIKWTDGESNTDTEFSALACKCAEECWLTIKQTDENLQVIDMAALVPDINCIFSSNQQTLLKMKIELKSSKNVTMPGSTIGKLDINQPLIYCLRPKVPGEGQYEIRYGQYHTAMGESDFDLFQDRTPRPAVNFNKLHLANANANIVYTEKKKDDWIPHYGKCAINRINKDKKINSSWQDTLTKSILFEALQHIHSLEDLERLKESVRPASL